MGSAQRANHDLSFRAIVPGRPWRLRRAAPSVMATRGCGVFIRMGRKSRVCNIATAEFQAAAQIPQRYPSADTLGSLRASSSSPLIRVYSPLSSLSHLLPFGNTTLRNLLTQGSIGL